MRIETQQKETLQNVHLMVNREDQSAIYQPVKNAAYFVL